MSHENNQTGGDAHGSDPALNGLQKRLVDRVSNPLLLEGLAHWEHIRGARKMPSRADIEPTELPRSLLPHVLLVEIHRQQDLQFRFRLIGTHIVTAMQRDATGRWLHELYTPEEFESVTASYKAMIDTGQPQHSIIRAPSIERDHLMLEAIDLPLSANGHDPDMVLALCHVGPRDMS